MIAVKSWCVVAAVAALAAAAAAEPEPAPQNGYLPPATGGYNYPPPSKPFLTPTTPRPPPTSYRPPPTTHSDGGTLLGEGIHGAHDHHHEPGMPFDFQYAVKDDQYGTDYSHNANSDGDVVRGEYRVALPDGRLQIVRYTADWATGFHADVSYEGEPRFPDGPAPAPGFGKRPGY